MSARTEASLFSSSPTKAPWTRQALEEIFPFLAHAIQACICMCVRADYGESVSSPYICTFACSQPRCTYSLRTDLLLKSLVRVHEETEGLERRARNKVSFFWLSGSAELNLLSSLSLPLLLRVFFPFNFSFLLNFVPCKCGVCLSFSSFLSSLLLLRRSLQVHALRRPVHSRKLRSLSSLSPQQSKSVGV